MQKKKNNKIFKIILGILIAAVIITAIVLIIIGCLPQESESHICTGNGCEVKI